jgi:hypothetical protein
MWSMEHGHLVRAVFGIQLNTIIRSRAGPKRLPQDATNSTLSRVHSPDHQSLQIQGLGGGVGCGGGVGRGGGVGCGDGVGVGVAPI